METRKPYLRGLVQPVQETGVVWVAAALVRQEVVVGPPPAAERLAAVELPGRRGRHGGHDYQRRPHNDAFFVTAQ